MEDHILDQSRNRMFQIVNFITLITEKSRIHDGHQIVQDIYNLCLIRLIVDITLVDRALLLVILQDIAQDSVNLIFDNVLHNVHSPSKRKINLIYHNTK